MLIQIAVGSGLLIVNITFAAIAAMALEVLFQRAHKLLAHEGQAHRLVMLLASVSLAVLCIATFGLWIWAVVYYWLGVFPTMEESVYFSLAAYTTLGLGDVVPTHEWRLLAGMEAANGFLNFGLLTALMIGALRQIRTGPYPNWRDD
ncbi:MAG: potassium channel family protein [Paracoccaceae bacterium]